MQKRMKNRQTAARNIKYTSNQQLIQHWTAVVVSSFMARCSWWSLLLLCGEKKSFICFMWRMVKFIQQLMCEKNKEVLNLAWCTMCVCMKSERAVIVSCSTILFRRWTLDPCPTASTSTRLVQTNTQNYVWVQIRLIF